MDKTRLLETIKKQNDKDAIGMILSNYADYGHETEGALISSRQFDKIADVIIEWKNQKKISHERDKARY